MNFRKILSILFFVSVFCSHMQAAKRQPEDQSRRERGSNKSRRDIESELSGAIVDDGPESSDDETGHEEWETTPELTGASCDAEVVEFCGLPVEIIPLLMNFLSLPDAVHLCAVDCLHMLFLPLVIRKRIKVPSDGTLIPTQLCDCLRVFISYLNCVPSFPEKDRGCLVDACASYVIQSAQQNINHVNTEVQRAALNLFRILFQHGRGFVAAITVAQQYITHEDESIRAAALGLFMILFQHGRGFVEAIAVAQQNITHENEVVREAVMGLFEALLLNIQHCPTEFRVENITQAIQAAQQNINHENLWVRRAALSLFRVLVKNIQHCPEELRAQIITQATEAAQQNINHVDEPIRNVARALQAALAGVQQ